MLQFIVFTWNLCTQFLVIKIFMKTRWSIIWALKFHLIPYINNLDKLLKIKIRNINKSWPMRAKQHVIQTLKNCRQSLIKIGIFWSKRVEPHPMPPLCFNLFFRDWHQRWGGVSAYSSLPSKRIPYLQIIRYSSLQITLDYKHQLWY